MHILDNCKGIWLLNSCREKYAMMFDEPVLLQAGWWYVAWARVSGPSSDCGSHGQASITTDDG